MAKQNIKDAIAHYEKMLAEDKSGKFKSFYILMGEEPFFSDSISEEIMNNALTPEERGFNQLLLYGTDVDIKQVIEASRRYPMMAARQLVVVREAQAIKDLEDLEKYLKQPLPTTILVLILTNKSLDKRKSLYKIASANKDGVVFESFPLGDSDVVDWINRYVAKKKMEIDPQASMLLADFSGTELGKLVTELDKLILNLSEGHKKITVSDIEENVGISREYNVFVLNKALSYKNIEKIYKIIFFFSSNPKQYPLVKILPSIFSHFTKVLKYHAIKTQKKEAGRGDAAAYLGIPPFYIEEYDAAIRNYPPVKCMNAIAQIRKYDYMGKSNEGGEATEGELLQEMIFKIIN